MDIRKLANAATVLLSAYLPFLWHDNIPTSEDSRRWEAAKVLWAELRPALGTALQTAIAAAEKPTETTLLALSNLLANLLASDKVLIERVETILSNGPFLIVLGEMTATSTPATLKRHADEWRRRILQPTGSEAPASNSMAAGGGVPACQVCGRQDDSLRVAVFPFVVSLVFVTFRRAFAGLWCAQHAGIRRLLATLITATVGWIGIPFGLLYTPMTLLTLARGGDQDKSINQKMLMDLARHKLQAGSEPQEAIRCLEAALEFGPAPAIETELRSLYTRYSQPHEGGGLRQIAHFLGVLFAAAVVGNIIGVLDYFISELLIILLGEEVTFVVAMLTWAPFIILLAAGGLILLQLIDTALRHTRTRRGLLAIVLAVLASLLAIHGILTGNVLADTLATAPLSQTFSTPLSVLLILSLIFTHGGTMILSSYFTEGVSPHVLYLVILIVMGGMYLISTIQRAQTITAGYRRVDTIYTGATGSLRPCTATGWLSILAAIFTFGMLLALPEIPALTMAEYGDPAAMELVMEGMTLLEEGNIAEARADFEEAKAIDPGSFMPHLGLGYVEMTLDNCQEAMEHMAAARDLAPPDMQADMAHWLGSVYHCTYQPDKAIALHKEALAINPSLVDVYDDLGAAYLVTGDFETAAEHFATAAEGQEGWATPYAGLAITYYTLDLSDQEAEALQQALAQPLDEPNEYTTLAAYYRYINDFQQAESYMRQGLEMAPYIVSNLSGLATIQIYQGNFNEAMEMADRILAIDAQNSEAFVIRSAIFQEQGDTPTAREVTEQGLKLNPDDDSLKIQLGYIMFDEGDYKAAMDQAEAIIASKPYYGSAYRLLALSQMETGNLDEAMSAAQEMLKLAPKDDVTYYIVGIYHMEAGNTAQAIEAFETFLSLTWDRRLVRDYKEKAEDHLAKLQE
ncbi:MAG: tetratricopeptide repeat protein [Anaerolineae bacterium]|nr:tetratricopeptide repeat protein [Anaerolineae bacterium]